MEPLYGYLRYRGTVLVPTDVQQKTTTAMERREQPVNQWSSTFCVSFFYYCFSIINHVKYNTQKQKRITIDYAFTIYNR